MQYLGRFFLKKIIIAITSHLRPGAARPPPSPGAGTRPPVIGGAGGEGGTRGQAENAGKGAVKAKTRAVAGET